MFVKMKIMNIAFCLWQSVSQTVCNKG